MEKDKISIIIPVVRPDSVKRCIASIKANAGIPESQYEIVTEVDTDRIGCPKMIKRLVGQANYNLVCFLGDDTEIEKDCLKNALEVMHGFPGGWGIVGLNDQHHDGNTVATHWLASKELLHYLDGEFFHTGYRHSRCDKELTERCIELGRYSFAENAKLIHNHPHFKTAITDNDYLTAYNDENSKHDWRLYRQRSVNRDGIKLGIGFPLIDEKVYVQFMLSYITMEKPDYTLLMPTFPVGEFAMNIADVRNDLVSQALSEDCTHFIMLDTDQIYPFNCITKLLSHNKDVVGTPVHRRWPPFDPILYRGELGKYQHVSDKECYSGELVKVDATGCACMLFNTEAFIDVPPPWFEIKKSANGKPIGEDIGFCSKLKGAGYNIYVDTSIVIGHLTTYEVNRSTYELYKKLNNFQYREA